MELHIHLLLHLQGTDMWKEKDVPVNSYVYLKTWNTLYKLVPNLTGYVRSCWF
jgi:hypothetical protein